MIVGGRVLERIVTIIKNSYDGIVAVPKRNVDRKPTSNTLVIASLWEAFNKRTMCLAPHTIFSAMRNLKTFFTQTSVPHAPSQGLGKVHVRSIVVNIMQFPVNKHLSKSITKVYPHPPSPPPGPGPWPGGPMGPEGAVSCR